MERNLENSVEFLTGDKTAAVSVTNRRFVNRLQKLFNDGEHGQEMLRFTENADGSLYCVIPLSWVRISPPRKMSEEQKQEQAARLQAAKTHSL